MLAGSAHFGLGDADGLATQVATLRALPEPMSWVTAVVDRLEGLRALLAGDRERAAGLLRASSMRMGELGLTLAAALGWLEWAELGLAGHLDAEAAGRVDAAATALARMGAHDAAERGRRLLRGPRNTAIPGRSGDLTEREREVAHLVAEGLSDPEIAERPFVSTRTVTTHLTNIYRRLGLSGRTALAHHLHTQGAAEVPRP